MIYKCSSNKKKMSGFTIIESLVYVFLTTLILSQGINIYVSQYKDYVEKERLAIKYNNYQNFFIGLDDIIAEGDLEKIIVDDNCIIFSKNEKTDNLDKKIQANQGNIFVKYMRENSTETINVMLEGVDNFEVKRKGKLIYIIVRDKEGEEFIKCI